MNTKRLDTEKITTLYERLSRDDEMSADDSNSIIHQDGICQGCFHQMAMKHSVFHLEVLHMPYYSVSAFSFSVRSHNISIRGGFANSEDIMS